MSEWVNLNDFLSEVTEEESIGLDRYDRSLLPVDEVVRLNLEVPLDVMSATEKLDYRSDRWLGR